MVSVLSGVRPPQQQPNLAQGLVQGQSARQSLLSGQQQLRQGEQALETGEQEQQLNQQAITEGQFRQGVQKLRVIRGLAKRVRELPTLQDRQAFVNRLDPKLLESVGIAPEEIQGVSLDDQGLDTILAQANSALEAAGDSSLTAEQSNRQALLRDLEGAIDPETGRLKPEDQLTATQRAAAIDLGLVARTGTLTGQERIATDPQRTQQVAGSQETIRRSESRGARIGQGEGVAAVADIEAEAAATRQRATDQASQSVKLSGDFFEKTQQARSSIPVLDAAIQAIDDGAQSGPIINRFTPTIRDSTLQLQQAGRQLGLDVISSVTFGALSESEMNLAMETAMPNLPPEQLRDWLLSRKEAQIKLANELEDSARFLSQGGTLDELLDRKGGSRIRRRDNQGDQGAGQGGNVIDFGDL